MARHKVPLFVTDASVVVKWFVDEEDSDKARALKARYTEGALDLVAPRLLEYELSNGLRFHPVVKRTAREVLEAISAVRGLTIMVDPPLRAWEKAMEVSLSEGISIYDAVYLALADATRGKLVSSDAVLKEKLSAKVKRNLALLGDLTL